VGALPTVTATRYVAPLREGGSLPALMEADDLGLYVVKFRGAGQGAKALVAELLAGGVGRRLGLAVPDLVLVEVDPVLGAAEPDAEIQDLLKASPGINVGLDFLPGALAFEPAAGFSVMPALAAEIVWFDALMTNVDRTPRNPNLLVWHDRLWLIDHGAAIYVHHETWHVAPRALGRFPAVREHVLLPYAGSVLEADARLAPRLDAAALGEITAAIPDVLLGGDREPGGPAERRAAYADYLARRLRAPRGFAEEAEDARAAA